MFIKLDDGRRAFGGKYRLKLLTGYLLIEALSYETWYKVLIQES